MAARKSEAKRKPTNDFDKKYDASRYRQIMPELTPLGPAPREAASLPPTLRASLPSAPEPSINDVCVSTPKTFKDVQVLVCALRRHEAVIVDMSGIHPDCVTRVLDYLSGAVYALEGTEKSVSKTIYMFTPKVNSRSIE